MTDPEQRDPLSQHLGEAAARAARRDWLAAAIGYGDALAVDGRQAEHWVQYAHMLKEAGLLAEAVEAYGAAIARDGSDPDPRLHLAHLLKRFGRRGEALAEFRAIEAIPFAPHVGPEIAQLTAALHDDDDRLPAIDEATGPEADACRALHVRLLATGGGLPAAPSAPVKRWRAKKADGPVPAQLEPARHLVTDGARFRATLPTPRFRIVLRRGWTAADLAGRWVEIRVRIDGAGGRRVTPLLYAEYAPGFADYAVFPLKRGEDGAYSVVARLRAPLVGLRLDPVQFAGVFQAHDFDLVRLSARSAIARAFRLDRRATLSALAAGIAARSATALAARLEPVFCGRLPSPYERWIDAFDPPPSPLAEAGEVVAAGRWPQRPRLSLLVDASAARPAAFAATLSAVRRQSYDRWQLVVLAGPATDPAVAARLSAAAEDDDRIVALRPPTSPDVPAAAMLAAADGAFVGLVEAGDVLAPGALYHFARTIGERPGAAFVYCDDDTLGAGGERTDPRFKPDWNRDYFLGFDYVGRLALLSRADLVAAGGFRPGPAGACDYAARLRLACRLDDAAVVHIARPLLSRGHAPRIFDARAAVAGVLAESAPVLKAEAGRIAGTARVRRSLPVPAPRVSIIIPIRDRAVLLDRCLASIFAKTDYPDYEVVVVDNGSVEAETADLLARLAVRGNVKVVPAPGPFNYSRLNNLGAAAAAGAVLALLNNDVEVISPDWLAEMVAEALRPEIGAVGAMLLYPGGEVQHAGIVGGVGALTGHGHKYFPGDAPGYMNRLAVSQYVLAVTGACLVVTADKYRAVGGLDEEALPIAYNDVDFCLKLAARGLNNLFTPYARLHHFEGVTRGYDLGGERAARFAADGELMRRRWGDRISRDPHYNPALTCRFEDFSLREPD